MKRNRDNQLLWTVRPLRAVLLGAAPIAASLFMAPPAVAQEQQVAFEIESQPLSSALLAFGRQADLSVLAPTELVQGKVSPKLSGRFSAAAALDRLLAGSGLSYVFVQANAVRIIAADRAALSPGDSETAGRDVVVVTGTNIKGVQNEASPLDVYTRADIARTGAATTEQFVAKLPQNLSSVSPNAIGASTRGSNFDAVSAVDLRGLGVGTTLTLLNGHRMALSNAGRSADVSLIPLGAIDRVEVLTDGASAIYGSDAIGGVVNFILRDDFEGSETRLSAGGVTSGGLRQGGAGHTTGVRWEQGRALFAYDYQTASALEVSDRSYAAAAGPGTLTPVDSRHNVFVTASHDLTDVLTVEADFGAGWRKVKSDHSDLNSPVLASQTINRHSSQTDLAFGNIELDYAVTDDLSASLLASYSEVDTDGTVSVIRFNLAPPTTTRTALNTRNSQFDVMAKLDGSLMQAPGGDVRYSIGAGVLNEKHRGLNPTSALQGAGTLGRRSTYGFGEVFVPLVAPAQGVPFVNALSVSLAARYTDYAETSDPPQNRDFGGSLDPKIGIAWSPTDALKLRGTYGSSFRAPALVELDPAGGAHFLIPNVVAGAPAIVLGMSGYPVPDLGPETANSFTLGFDYSGREIPGFTFSASYYNIDYTNRIGTTPIGGLNPFANPAALPDLIYRPPSAAFIEDALRATRLVVNASGVNIADPAAGAAALFARSDVWIYDVRYRNLAMSQQDGIDLSLQQDLETGLGDLQLGIHAAHILNYEQKASAASPVVDVVDVPSQPADWKGRAHASLTSGPFNGTLSINYVDDYANPFAPVGAQTVESWTTVDMALGYDLSAIGFNRDSRVSLSVQNLFDQDPPFLRAGTGSGIRFPVGFDPANANPFGRLVMLTLTQSW